MYRGRLGEVIRLIGAAIRYPRLFEMSIPQQGLGLERRYERCSHYWAEHIDHCKNAQKKCLEELKALWPNKELLSLSIIGAGRLYDLDIGILREQTEKIFLQDADPLCSARWRSIFKADYVSSRCGISDITSVFEPWYLKIKKSSGKISILEEFKKLSQSLNHSYSEMLLKHDLILSQNILSQIPIYFLETTKSAVQKSSLKDKLISPKQLDDLYREAKQFFINQHLQSLNSSPAKMILLTTDVSSCEYVVDKLYSKNEVSPPPVLFREHSWSPNNLSDRNLLSASYQNLLEPVIGPDLSELESIMTNYKATHTDTWTWHISPQGVDTREVGSVHLVKSIRLVAKNG